MLESPFNFYVFERNVLTQSWLSVSHDKCQFWLYKLTLFNL